MKKQLLKLIGDLVGEAVTFGTYEQYSEAGDYIADSSDRIYLLTEQIIIAVTGKKPTKKELESFLSPQIGIKGQYDNTDEEDYE